MVFWNSLATESARCNKKRRSTADVTKIMGETFCRIFTPYVVRYGVIIRNEIGRVAKKKKPIPVFDHTYCMQGLSRTSENSIKETAIG